MPGEAPYDLPTDDQISFLDLGSRYGDRKQGNSEKSTGPTNAASNFKWDQNPRLYCIFHTIDRLELLDMLVEREFTDMCLPIESEAQLVSACLDPAIRPLFLEAQRQALCVQEDFAPEFQLGQGNVHGHLMTDAGLPIRLLRSVGKGGTASVDEVSSLKDGRVYARKSTRRDSAFDVTGFQREIRALGRSKHVHCVELVRTLLSVFAGYIPRADCGAVCLV